MALTQSASAQLDIKVILCEIPTDARSVVPGARDLTGAPVVTRFKAIEDFNVSHDGSAWIVKARSELGSDLENNLLLGSGLTGDMFAQEGQPFAGGVAGELYDFFDTIRPAAWNENGHIAFTARARGGVASVFEKVVVYDGSTHTIVLQMGDPALGLIDFPPNPSGDETFGNSMSGIQLRNDGTVGFFVTPIGNCHSFRYPALFYGNTSFRQSGVSDIGGEIWDNFDLGEFGGTPDGAHWYAQGDTENPNTAIDDILAVGDVIVLQEGSPVAGSSVILAEVFDTRMVSNGDWFSRGDDPLDNDWAVASGVLVAKTGDEIGTTGEHLGAIFLSFTGNRTGDWVLIANTDRADPARDTVVLLNGEVVIREGDPIDLDGNGQFDDDVFIGRGNNTLSAFAAFDIFLTDDRMLYFIAPLRDAAGNDLGSIPPFGAGGEAFMRVQLPGAGCPTVLGDVNGDGVVDGEDITGFVACMLTPGAPTGPCVCADFDSDGDIDGADLDEMVQALTP